MSVAEAPCAPAPSASPTTAAYGSASIAPTRPKAAANRPRAARRRSPVPTVGPPVSLPAWRTPAGGAAPVVEPSRRSAVGGRSRGPTMWTALSRLGTGPVQVQQEVMRDNLDVRVPPLGRPV